MTREARAAAVEGRAIDLDIVNCYPSLLCWLMQRLGLQCPESIQAYATPGGRRIAIQAVQDYIHYRHFSMGRLQEADVKTAFLSALFGRRPMTWQVDIGIPGSLPPAPALQEFFDDSRSAIQQIMSTPTGRKVMEEIRARDPSIADAKLHNSALSYLLAQLESAAIQVAEAVCRTPSPGQPGWDQGLVVNS
jgi:hypothetical protein